MQIFFLGKFAYANANLLSGKVCTCIIMRSSALVCKTWYLQNTEKLAHVCLMEHLQSFRKTGLADPWSLLELIQSSLGTGVKTGSTYVILSWFDLY